MAKMRLVHHHRAEPPLPEMAGPAMTRIDEAGVAAVRVGEGPPQAVLVRRHDDDVDMVGHQAIAPDLRARPVRRLGEQIAIERVVAVLEEGLRAPVAALGHVIGNSREERGAGGGPWRRLRYLVHLVNWHRNSTSPTEGEGVMRGQMLAPRIRVMTARRN